MIRDEWRLAIQVEVHGWVKSTKFERFWVCGFDWEIDERMMIYTKCARIESQTEEIKMEIWNWLGKAPCLKLIREIPLFWNSIF